MRKGTVCCLQTKMHGMGICAFDLRCEIVSTTVKSKISKSFIHGWYTTSKENRDFVVKLSDLLFTWGGEVLRSLIDRPVGWETSPSDEWDHFAVFGTRLCRSFQWPREDAHGLSVGTGTLLVPLLFKALQTPFFSFFVNSRTPTLPRFSSSHTRHSSPSLIESKFTSIDINWNIDKRSLMSPIRPEMSILVGSPLIDIDISPFFLYFYFFFFFPFDLRIYRKKKEEFSDIKVIRVRFFLYYCIYWTITWPTYDGKGVSSWNWLSRGHTDFFVTYSLHVEVEICLHSHDFGSTDEDTCVSTPTWGKPVRKLPSRPLWECL